MAHYSIDPHLHLYHDLLRRGMYVPIIFAAVWSGTTGGVVTAVVGALLYAPHLFFQLRLTSIEEIDRTAEMILYVIVGGLTGLLAERERWQRQQTEETLDRLRHAHDELQRQADRLTEVQEGLRQAERLSTLGELAADLAHEIRNPLAALRGTVQILAGDFPPEHRKHEFAGIVLQELDRLDGVVEGYLRTARARSTRGGQSDIEAVLTTVVQLTKPQAERNKVAVELRGGDRLFVPLDSDQLTQVFMNLALNAIQAMPRGGTLRIDCRRTVGADSGESWGEVTFADTGTGVTMEDRERIFRPFFTTKATGTGLGLSIARRLVDEHGGSLTLEAPAERGSVFRVRLPLVVP